MPLSSSRRLKVIGLRSRIFYTNLRGAEAKIVTKTVPPKKI